MIIHGWKFEKKMDCSKRPSEKEKEKEKRKRSWTKEKKREKKYKCNLSFIVKLVKLMLFEKKEKLCYTNL